MTIDRAAFVDAISEAFSPRHGELAAALLSEAPGDTVPVLHAGKVAAAVLAELPEASALAALDRMSLVGADIRLGDEHAYLDAAGVLAREDLCPFVAKTAGDQVAAAIAATLLGDQAEGAPVLTGVGAVQVGMDLHCFIADLRYVETGGMATLHFGHRFGPADHRVVREASGELLAGIGRALAAAGACPFTMPGIPVAVPMERGTLH